MTATWHLVSGWHPFFLGIGKNAEVLALCRGCPTCPNAILRPKEVVNLHLFWAFDVSRSGNACSSFLRDSSPLAIAVYRSALGCFWVWTVWVFSTGAFSSLGSGCFWVWTVWVFSTPGPSTGAFSSLESGCFWVWTVWVSSAPSSSTAFSSLGSCNFQTAYGRKHKKEDRKNWTPLKSGEKNPCPTRKCLIGFTFLCVSVGNHGKAWKNRQIYLQKNISFQNVRLLTVGAFVLDYLLKSVTETMGCQTFFRLSMILPMTVCLAQPILDRELFKQSFAAFFNVLSVYWYVRLKEPMRGVFKKSWAFVILMQLPLTALVRPAFWRCLSSSRSLFFFAYAARLRSLSFSSWASRFLLSWNYNKNWIGNS